MSTNPGYFGSETELIQSIMVGKPWWQWAVQFVRILANQEENKAVRNPRLALTLKVPFVQLLLPNQSIPFLRVCLRSKESYKALEDHGIQDMEGLSWDYMSSNDG